MTRSDGAAQGRAHALSGSGGVLGCLASLGCVHYPLELATDERLAAAVASLEIAADAAVFVGAGDIARCDPAAAAAAAATGKLLSLIVGMFPEALVFTTGDHAYPDGTPWQFEECYQPVWGSFNERTRPTPGNHDYRTPGAAGYYDYFQFFAEEPTAAPHGYYRFDLGAWGVVALNSVTSDDVPTQAEWLAESLAADPRECLLAYWHNPLFSSGFHSLMPWDDGRDTRVFWQVLLGHGADVILNGHDHLYERFAPQDADGRVDASGARQFVVGTGGAGLHRVVRRRAQSEYADDRTFGVLLMALRPSSYEWAFVGVDGVVHDRSAAPVACGDRDG